ncbi:hypothetical protein [Erwinia phage Snitter]|nr:hypothetical protein [Erwinia phage Snitter]
MILFLLGVVVGSALLLFLAKLLCKFGHKKDMIASVYHDKEKDTYRVRGNLDKIFNGYRARRFEKPGAIKYID